MTIQVITDRTLQSENSITISRYSKPMALDDFDMNFIDLSTEALWYYNKNYDIGLINSYSDLHSIKKMVSTTKKAKIIYVYPQNFNYCYDYDYDYSRQRNIFQKSMKLKQMMTKTDCKTNMGKYIPNESIISETIYDWLCDNIQYDTTKSIHDADTCWRTKKGVCQAYCNLFCHIAGDRLNVEIIVGKCKTIEGDISDTSHAWLYVYTDGYNGIFIDPTWGAGGISDGRFVQGINRDIWFDVDPAWIIFSHYPKDNKWKMLDYDISEEQFKQLPLLFPDSNKKALDELSYHLSRAKP